MKENQTPEKGLPIPVKLAQDQYKDFILPPSGSPHVDFPTAVCYRIEELRKFLNDIEAKFNEKNIPKEEQGIALTFGIHLGKERAHAKNKVTVMLIATQYVENDPKLGKVDKINNPIIHFGYGDMPPEFDALCYDAASLYP